MNKNVIINKELKIREENDFYLLINLNTEDVLNGYPSYFKINETGKLIIEALLENLSYDSVLEKLTEVYPDYSDIKSDLDNFWIFLQRYGLIKPA